MEDPGEGTLVVDLAQDVVGVEVVVEDSLVRILLVVGKFVRWGWWKNEEQEGS